MTSVLSNNNTLMNITIETSTIPIIDHLYHTDQVTQINIISVTPIQRQGVFISWFFNQIKRLGTRGLLIGSIVASGFLLFLLFIIVRLHCTNRPTRRKNLPYTYSESNGKTYSQLNQQNKRYSISPPDGRDSKKHVPKLLRYLHTNETKPTSFRLSTNGSDSYHLISSLKDSKSMAYRNSDCVLSEHCCIHPSLSQPVSSSASMYHQVNRLMSSGSDPPLGNIRKSNPHISTTATLRSLKKDLANSSAQTYSAVYSCDLAANLDIDQEVLQKRSSIKRRSILKNTQSSVVQPKILFLYVKNLLDCYALQPNNRTNNEPILLATANENRIQLSHALVSKSDS
jgi:hypothetical protein